MLNNDMDRDNYIDLHLPPRDQWPDFINTDCVSISTSFNCAAELVDKAESEGYGDKIAIYSPGIAWSYSELAKKTNQIARMLTEDFGLLPGNRVLLRGPNTPMLAACWLAVIKAGGVCVTTMPLLRAKEIAVVANRSQASLALCDGQSKDDMHAALKETDSLKQVIYFNGEPGGLENAMASKSEKFECYQARPDEAAIIGFTSGTTGKPKGAVHSHHAILAVCETYSKTVLQPSADDIFTGTPPLAFVYGLGGLLLFPLHARASTVMLADVKPQSLIGAIDQFKISVIFTAPTAYKGLLEMYDANADKLASLKKGVSAGEALPAFVTQGWMDKAGIRLLDGIGSTELLHIFLSVQKNEDPIGCLGRPVPGYEAKIIDEAGSEVQENEVGLLAVRGPTGCRYLDDERQREYVQSGWNITGDTARKDEHGIFWYVARSDGMIVSSGYNIAAPEVEATLSQHPAVKECAVVGVPDKERGNIVCAYIVLKDDFEGGDDLVKDIQNFAKEQSAPYKYPRSIKFVDALPRTLTGKIQHFVLRESTAKGNQ